MATPHIAAEKGDFAPAVLMPGDPRRAERIANLLMPDARKVSDVRGIGAYTGTVDGKPLSVMASGMGMPSLGIYANELFSQFDVQRIIRVGTAGGLAHKVKVGDVVVALGAHTDSAMNTTRIPGIHFSAVASYPLVAAAVAAAGADTTIHVAPVVSRDHFYGNPAEQIQALADYGTLAVEMEAAGLYAIAAQYDREALAVLTISDHLLDHSQDMTAEEREHNFERALALAVAAAHC
ncbi:purine-nucleoside phosphorylase [Georgenia yuyongxinii]|uniref:Purine-nucleoside phosphorylase n=1 Tax=Georgenia yuyongxinii TaxID=2589797 RepID=A0A5B8C6A5_9MICO|nr:purine-nucleoside phosphorylase [Georgenia yuyongxinii]QDC24921.1 purine-nucleoside phosphorylase [Georgenia yuyongxinii]